LSRKKSRRRNLAGAKRVDAAIVSPMPTRRAVFLILTLALPIAVLALLELGLRLSGFGHDLEPLFIASPQRPDYLQANPRVVTRFFTDPARAPSVSIETAYFRASKQPGTLRVFVQGESSAAGFPYGLGASLAGVLDQRLERAFPSREIEVISTAMAAVNSYALLDFADEIIAQQPDAVIVYAGHNEYLGILGVGSTLRVASNSALTRAFLAVRELRLFQVMSRLIGDAMMPGGGDVATTADTLMARVAGERFIALNSALYQRGIEQFETNLSPLLDKYRDAGIRVFIGTLVSNERDQMPLAVLGGAESDAAGAAKTAYHAAQDAEAAKRFAAAREGYAWARDLDPLRFRAPAAFNETVGAVAKAHGAILVDAHAAFLKASPHELIGNKLLLEHVHPNLDGYFLLADAFFDAMVAHGLPGRPEVDVLTAEARADMPVSDIDRYLGDYKVLRIKSGWPFAASSHPPQLPRPASEGERLAQDLYFERISWPTAQDQLRRHYQAIGDKARYGSVTVILADAFPFAGTLQFEAAAALIDIGRPADALRYSRRSVELEPRNVNALLVHAHALLRLARYTEGRGYLERVLVLEPGNATARRVLAELAER
jgi:lysophospholipase L1-like esterase